MSNVGRWPLTLAVTLSCVVLCAACGHDGVAGGGAPSTGGQVHGDVQDANSFRDRSGSGGNPNAQGPTLPDPNVTDPNTQDPNTQDPNIQDPNTQDPNAQNPNTQDPNGQNPNSQNPNGQNPNGTPPQDSNTARVCPLSSGVCTNPNDEAAAMADPTIDAGQCPYCQNCASRGYRRVTGCSAVVGTSMPCQSFCHVPNTVAVTYCSDPPASGDHNPTPEHGCGEHTQPVPRRRYVHSMEHGAVILQYNCPQGCDAELTILRQVVAARLGHKVILTPDPLLSGTRFAATSWTWVYRYDQPDYATLLCFIDQHEDNARELKPLCW